MFSKEPKRKYNFRGKIKVLSKRKKLNKVAPVLPLTSVGSHVSLVRRPRCAQSALDTEEEAVNYISLSVCFGLFCVFSGAVG